MRNALFALWVVALCVVAARAQAPSVSIDAASIDAAVSEAMAYWKTPGVSVVIVRGDEVVYLKGFGVRDVGTKQPVTPDTVFAIGSTTKAFTTAAMALLIDDGRMRWDDPVRKHLPYFRLSDPLASDGVALRDIVTHRTGLIRHDLLWYNSPWSREEIIRRIGFVPLTYPFRTTFQYQNIMFLTAGQAVAASSGMSYEDFVQKRIFDPLGMTSASLTIAKAQQMPDHATPHAQAGAAIVPIPWRSLDNVGPAGSINASARDLSSWLRLQLNEGVFAGKRLISAANMREMHAPQQVIRLEGRWKLFFPESDTAQLSYGLGWFINDYRGHQLVMHGGTIDGFRASIMLEPKARLAVAVLANLNGVQMPEATGYRLMDLLLGLPKKDWNTFIGEAAKAFDAETARETQARLGPQKQGARPSRELAAYAGKYEDEGYGAVEVAATDDRLSLRWSNFNTPLSHYHFDTFLPQEARLKTEPLTFTLGADGNVSGLNFLGVAFRKTAAK